MCERGPASNHLPPQAVTPYGLSKLEIIRCLKRYIAREVFHNLPYTTADEPIAESVQASA